MTLVTRPAWRPPWNFASMKAARISVGGIAYSTRPPIATKLASLCSRAIVAVRRSWMRAQRMPVDLIGRDRYADAGAAKQDAEIVAAFLVFRAGCRGHVGVVDPVLDVDSEVHYFLSPRIEPGCEFLLRATAPWSFAITILMHR